MGFRFRKSINLGGGFKVNLSKSGIGYSWGTKGARFTKTAKGKNRTTLSIPGTGLSYVTESGSAHKNTAGAESGKSNKQSYGMTPHNTKKNEDSPKTSWVKFIICLLFGYLGIHKFIEKKTGMGLLYLFTLGLFGLGWLYDCVKYLIAAIKSTSTKAAVQNTSDTYIPNKADAPASNPVEIPPISPIEQLKQVLPWILIAIFGIFGFVGILSGGVLTGIFAFLFVALMLPIKGWQSALGKYLNGKAKTVIAIVLAISCFALIPHTKTPDENDIPPAIAATETSAVTTEPTARPTTEPATDSTNQPTTEPATQPTTQPPTEPATQPSTQPPTEPVTQPTTQPPTESVTQPATQPPTEPATQPATQPSTEPATQPTTQPPTESVTQPANEGITFIAWPQTISRNETGTVTIKGKPNTSYTITVYYKSGPSTADGLGTKTSDGNGYVTWNWKIGGRTSFGTFKIVVSGGGESKSVHFTIVD